MSVSTEINDLIDIFATLTLNASQQFNRNQSAINSTQTNSSHDLTGAIVSVNFHRCVLCGKAFKRRSDLACHMEGPHRRVYVGLFQCQDSHYSTARKSNYKRHLFKCRRKNDNSHYCCRCGKPDVEKERHIAHVIACRLPRDRDRLRKAIGK